MEVTASVVRKPIKGNEIYHMLRLVGQILQPFFSILPIGLTNIFAFIKVSFMVIFFLLSVRLMFSDILNGIHKY